MPKLVQINVTANWGSTGKIAEDIGKMALANGWESYIAYGRETNPNSSSQLIPIGNKWDMYFHGLQTRILDNHGLASKRATKDLIDKIKIINPDIIHLHNIHGYFINYKILFEYLALINKPVVWTLHDCWTFTGHCAYFDMVNCDKWKNGCVDCKHKYTYPSSAVFCNSRNNYLMKQKYFNLLRNMTLVPVSNWLSLLLEDSFLNSYPKLTIHNGINVDVFVPNSTIMNKNKYTIIGVASIWDKRKGLKDFFEIRKCLPNNYEIILIGLTKEQIATLPDGIRGISRTNSLEELVAYYSSADVYVNPTYEDNFPTTNIEALACGTPIITYNTGGSVEAVDLNTGRIVEKGNTLELANCIVELCNNKDKATMRNLCRQRAVNLFNKDNKFKEYIKLYQSLLK